MRTIKADGIDLAPFKAALKDRCGLNFDDTREALLREGIGARMSKCSLRSSGAYLDRLSSSDEEFNQLIDLLTINETYFFREPAHLALLAEKIVPEVLAARPIGEKVKIVCAGCSTGEEPYSVAMALQEKFGGAARNIASVIGFDIDGQTLKRAKEGVFGAHSFRGFSPDLRERYFERQPNGSHRLRASVREAVEFIRLNLMADAYPDALKGADVVFYRNVSIYFEPEIQRKILRKLAGILGEGGCIFMASSETYVHDIGVMPLVCMDDVFLFRKKAAAMAGASSPKVQAPAVTPLAAPASPSPGRGKVKVGRHAPSSNMAAVPVAAMATAPAAQSPPPAKPTRGAGDAAGLFEDAISLAREKRYEEALSTVESLLASDPSFTRAYMLKAGILMNRGELDEADAACLKGIETDRWCLEAHVVLGMTARMRADFDTAVKRFKEALYIQSSSWVSHYYLAEVYSSAGDVKNACREYEVVLKLLGKGLIEEHGLTFFPVPFHADQLMHLCRRRVSEMRGAKWR